MSFRVTTAAFANGAAIPRRFTCDGEDLSPALEWAGEPANTKSFALIVDDPDAPGGTWNHWLLWDIPASVHALEEGDSAAAATSGTNDFGNEGYGGPCPPRGRGPHRYFFRLFAVDVPSLGLPRGARRDTLERALRSHALGKAEYQGHYGRR
jgi:hypothetical protein